VEIIKIFLDMFSVLTRKQKKEFLILQFIMLFAALFELISVTSVIPLMALIADANNLYTIPFLLQLKEFVGIDGETNFLILLGGMFISAMFISNMIIVTNIYLSERFSSRLSAEISSKLLLFYLERDILELLGKNQSIDVTNIFTFCPRACSGILGQALVFNSKMATSITLLLTIAIVDPVLTVLIVSVIGGFYGIIYFKSKIHLEENSKIHAKYILASMRLVREALSDIKSIRLYKLKDTINAEYYDSILKANRSDAHNAIITNIPYHLMEIVAVTGIVLMFLFYSTEGKNITDHIDKLAFLALAGFRTLSSFQKSYNCVTRMRGTIPQYLRIKEDLTMAHRHRVQNPTGDDRKFEFNKPIKVNELDFQYNDKSNKVFSSLSIEIPPGSVTVIAGKSGGGKSTLLELIIGLLHPQEGNIKIGEQPIDRDSINSWQDNISYVSQSPFISDKTIAENIAYGCHEDQIDHKKITELCEIVQLGGFINTLDNGVKSEVGDNAFTLSGGEKQRMGIARALYRNTPIIIFDESTSALDKETEKLLWDSVLDYCTGKIVIIVTHDSSSIDQNYNQIHV